MNHEIEFSVKSKIDWTVISTRKSQASSGIRREKVYFLEIVKLGGVNRKPVYLIDQNRGF